MRPGDEQYRAPADVSRWGTPLEAWGPDLAAVQRIMRRHAPRITTEVYGHLAPGYLRKKSIAFASSASRCPRATPAASFRGPPQRPPVRPAQARGTAPAMRREVITAGSQSAQGRRDRPSRRDHAGVDRQCWSIRGAQTAARLARPCRSRHRSAHRCRRNRSRRHPGHERRRTSGGGTSKVWWPRPRPASPPSCRRS